MKLKLLDSLGQEAYENGKYFGKKFGKDEDENLQLFI